MKKWIFLIIVGAIAAALTLLILTWSEEASKGAADRALAFCIPVVILFFLALGLVGGDEIDFMPQNPALNALMRAAGIGILTGGAIFFFFFFNQLS